MAADVQNWLTAPTNNFGWMLIGNEAFHVTSARRFDSRETAGGSAPRLLVSYLGTPPLTRRETWLQQYFPVGHFVADLADLDGDGLVNLIEYALAFSPIAANAPGVQMSVAPAGANRVFTITFRRDPRATDLTYTLETSGDLAAWTALAQSTTGAVPAGAGFVSEADAAGEAPVKIVTVRETVPAPLRRFARLRVGRAP